MAVWNYAGLVEHLMVNYRWLFVCFFLLPLSVLYDLYFYVRNWIIFKLSSAPTQHNYKVLHVQQQVREWRNSGSKKPMCTSRAGWLRMSFRVPKYQKTMANIELNLVDILEVDQQRGSVRVEPLVNMGQITATLIPLGWTLPVVPELDDLTVGERAAGDMAERCRMFDFHFDAGGLLMGAGIETSSHHWGLFQHIVLSVELVLPDGKLVKCTEDENADLFYAIPWSHGTIGFLVAAELRIIPSKPYIRMQYLPCKSLEETLKTFESELLKPENQFVEGIVYSRNEAVVMSASFADHPGRGQLVNSIGRWHKPWFFEHAQSCLQKGTLSECIPLRHYYHRHSRSIFWELQDIIPFGNRFWFRWLFGWAMPPKVSFLKLTQGKTIKRLYEQHHFIQDMLVPLPALKQSILLFDEQLQLYPLWLCPFRLPSHPGLVHSQGKQDQLYVDIGAYGSPKAKTFDATATTRRLEEHVRAVNGFQMLYADTYATREEFRSMFDHSLYDSVRKKHDCESAFPEIYDKVSLKARY